MECKSSVVAPVEAYGGGIGESLRNGFVLKWKASNCSICEDSGGNCGFDSTMYHFKCFCPDRPHAWDCTNTTLHEYLPEVTSNPHTSSIVQMSLKNLKVFNLRTILTSAALVLSLVNLVQCQDVNDYNNNQFDNPAVLPLITQVVYSQISNLTAVIGQDIGNQSSFCIRDCIADVPAQSRDEFGPSPNENSVLRFLTTHRSCAV
nr:abc transporter g family member 24 [Quercus suber]